MKRSFWITLFVSISACAAAMIALEIRNKNLAGRLAAEQVTLKPADTQRVVTPAPIDSTAPEERIDRALEAVAGLTATLPPESEGHAQQQVAQREFRKIIPELLRSVEGLDADGLIAVARDLPASSRARSFLVRLAAEQDPQQVLGNEELMSGIPKMEMLGALARTDPAAALSLLPPMNAEKIENRKSSLIGNRELSARIDYATQLLGVDFDRGMAALQEVHDVKSCIPIGIMGSLGLPTVPEDSIPGLIEAMGQPEYAAMRDDLRELTVMSTLVNQGVDQVARHVNAMNLSPQELDRTIRDLMGMDVMASEPEPMLAWLADAQPDRVSGALIRWADQDVAGATRWLAEQPPSPIRDRALSEFALEASKIDPEGAATWAREIQNEDLREQTLQQAGAE